ncbi:MAG TPA: hypothetical protein VKU40_04380, partial [Thermoanaerobaculia bacterium]|nr:hypothetical protein [Thermoanaerobaculia bacterium]
DEPRAGAGRTVDGAPAGRSGYFWFFREDNVELIVKILDGTAINGEHWVFYGALSDVEYWVTVVDHHEERVRTYRSPPGAVCGRGDTTPFTGGEAPPAPPLTARLGSGPPLHALAFDAIPPGLGAKTAAAHPFVPCVPDDETLCLGDGGRFQVRVAWQDQHNGGSGVGQALPFTDKSGFFWFFRQDNVELVVKVLDGTAINGKSWFFYGALSDVGYEIEVLDTADGHAVRQYVNPPGNLCGEADTTAF